MKQVVKCVGCDKIVGLYKSYKAMVTETPIVNGVRLAEVKYEGRICQECAEGAGYKTKRSKKHEPEKSEDA